MDVVLYHMFCDVRCRWLRRFRLKKRMDQKHGIDYIHTLR